MNWYIRRLHTWETNFGRDAGWIIHLQGKPAVRLSAPQFFDMFWDSYIFTILSDDPGLKQKLATVEFWTRTYWSDMELLSPQWRNVVFDSEPYFALPGGEPFDEKGRFVVRGLYLNIGGPNLLDSMILWIRRVLGLSFRVDSLLHKYK